MKFDLYRSAVTQVLLVLLVFRVLRVEFLAVCQTELMLHYRHRAGWSI